MTRIIYYVLLDNGKWTIRVDGREYTYPTKGAATDAAIAAAHYTGKTGQSADVMVQKGEGAWRTAWRSDHDHFPPK